ncbi:MAG TPA: hypothetical protein PK875_05710 [Spirochaetota bacterium]|mgnify:FL=1|nr:hypothetical protein [Spirochaetota bacterium]
MLIVRRDGARAGDTLYLACGINPPGLERDCSTGLLRGILQVFAPTALAATDGGILAAAREISKHAGLGYRIMQNALPAAVEAGGVDPKSSGYLFCSPRRPVATMAIAIDGTRVVPIGELVPSESALENGNDEGPPGKAGPGRP